MKRTHVSETFMEGSLLHTASIYLASFGDMQLICNVMEKHCVALAVPATTRDTRHKQQMGG